MDLKRARKWSGTIPNPYTHPHVPLRLPLYPSHLSLATGRSNRLAAHITQLALYGHQLVILPQPPLVEAFFHLSQGDEDYQQDQSETHPGLRERYFYSLRVILTVAVTDITLLTTRLHARGALQRVLGRPALEVPLPAAGAAEEIEVGEAVLAASAVISCLFMVLGAG